MSFRQHSYLRPSLCPRQTDVFIYMSDLIRKTKDSAHSLVLLLIQDKRGGEIWAAEIRRNKKAHTCDSNQTAVCSPLYAVTAVCGLTWAGRRVSQGHWSGASGSLFSMCLRIDSWFSCLCWDATDRVPLTLCQFRCSWAQEACLSLGSELLPLWGPPSKYGRNVWGVQTALQVESALKGQESIR